MPHWQKKLSYAVLLMCSGSGLIYLIGHEWGIFYSYFAHHRILIWHGISGYFMIFIFGSLLPSHILKGFKSKKNWVSGNGLIISLVLLVISGLNLYYGSELTRDFTISLHWFTGLVFVATTITHVIRSKLIRKFIQA